MAAFDDILIGPRADAGAFWITILWVFVFGAIIGSFLNVVIYRLPRTISLVHPGSRCGSCGRAIRWYDNVPVLSWFVLRGRCRDCGAAFSSRYPIVEAATGAMFMALAIAGPLRGEPVDLQPQTPATLWALFCFRAALMCVVWSAAWIKRDGQPLPLSLLLFGLVCGALPAQLWPNLYGPPRWLPINDLGLSLGWQSSLLQLVGGLLGIALFAAAQRIAERPDTPARERFDAALLGAAWGLAAGPSGALAVGVALVAAAALVRFAIKARRSEWERNFVFAIWLIAFAWFAGGESILARLAARLYSV